MTRRVALAVAAALVVPALAGCGEDADDRPTLTVLAAASLTSVLEELAEDFEAEHDVTVQLSFGGSADLATQVAEGATADVVATADPITMDLLVDAGLVDGDPVELATNTMVVVVPPANPGNVEGLADLAREDLRVVVCALEVPCGNAAALLAEEAGVSLARDSEEQSVTDVLGKVESGEADAGLVYVTDAVAAGDGVESVPVPEAARVVNHYPVAVLEDALQPALARAWVDFLLDEGLPVLAEAGFGPPGG
ncbi:molybdate ABC transporter substrate-binding protein [Nocardioides sp. J54]|uniref:molybdate ABC transporter substrate-binding protein n=1 Tax=Nocardioides sp. J54 TaxID=935866 RepID=UPI00048E3C9E|nr:molybdate ABC transporter substrate-binding protein [Nocardioides sp. J54]